jgi:hypothetical protein
MVSLTPEVTAFLSSHITSLDELQVLMACVAARDRWWDATSMGRELGMATGQARRALDALARGNLLDIRITEDVRYQFKPGTSDLEAAALACAAACRTSPMVVIQRLAETPRRGVYDFADAFRIRGDDHR